MDIVTCLDKNFVMPTGVMLYSVCANNVESDIVFHLVVDESVTDKDKNDLMETVTAFEGKSVLFYQLSSIKFKNFPALKRQNRLTQATYYRLMLGEILPSSVHKVLYLDGDIVVRHSLHTLWETDLTDIALAASPSALCGYIVFYNRLKIPCRYGYFNAGVLLINLDYWRAHNVIKDFENFVETRNKDILLHDQDVLNGVLFNKKIFLPIRYNMIPGFLSKRPTYEYLRYEKEVLESRKDPVIIHYADCHPWKYSRDPHPFASTFFLYQAKTRWKDSPIIDKRTLFLRLRHLFADVLIRMGIKSKRESYFVKLSPLD